MPIFEYRCAKCGEEFEKLVFSSSAAVSCPRCASTRLTRKISSFAAKTSQGFTSSAAGGGCSGCSSGNCGSCR